MMAHLMIMADAYAGTSLSSLYKMLKWFMIGKNSKPSTQKVMVVFL